MGRRRSAERPHREAARGGGREARAALEAERSNDESAAKEPFPRASAAARSALPQRRAALLLRRGAGYAAKAFAAGTEPRGGSRVQTGALKLRSASEKRPVNAKPPSVCASRRKPAAFGAAAHRSQKIGGAKALLLIGGAQPEREERRGDTQTGAGTPFPERRGTAGGQTHSTAAHRKRLRAGTAMRERGIPCIRLNTPPGTSRRSKPLLWLRNDTRKAAAGPQERLFGGAADTAARPRRAAAWTSQSRIAAAHVPNPFRLCLGVPVLCRLRTVRPPEAASRSPPHDPRLSEAAI